jgi:hypothetical protein
VKPASVLASLLCGLQIAVADPPTLAARPAARNESLRAVLTNLRPVLSSAGKAGRIYYRAICAPDDDKFPLRFPKIDVQRPAATGADLSIVRSIFRLDPDVTAAEGIPGIVRVRIGTVPDAILRTHLSTLKLTPTEQYNSFLAIEAIANSSQVRSVMEKLHIGVPVRAVNMPFVLPADGLPHLPPELLNVTMDQALDMVAKTWGGIVFYGACTDPDMYEVFDTSESIA